MQIDNPKTLLTLLSWCRRNGVAAIELGDTIKVAFIPGHMPPPRTARPTRDPASPPVDDRTGYTDDELYGSADP